MQRLEDAAREVDARVIQLRAERNEKNEKRAGLLEAIAESVRALDNDIRALEELRVTVRAEEEIVTAAHADADAREAAIREARADHEEVRSDVARLEIVRATAESDLAHLASQAAEAVQASLDQVLAEVEQMGKARRRPQCRTPAPLPPRSPRKSGEEGSESPAVDVGSSSAAAALDAEPLPQSDGGRCHREAAGQD